MSPEAAEALTQRMPSVPSQSPVKLGHKDTVPPSAAASFSPAQILGHEECPQAVSFTRCFPEIFVSRPFHSVLA